MALFLFTKAIIEDNPIKVFNQGNMIRDFTYIDDIIESVFRVLNKPPKVILYLIRAIRIHRQVGHLIEFLISETLNLHL